MWTQTRLKNVYLKEQLANATSVAEIPPSPMQVKLFQNLPNPFNLQTTIPFYIPETGPVRWILTDLSGKEVKVLVNQTMSAGSYRYDFGASQLPTGVYLIKLNFNSQMVVKKMIRTK